MYRRTHDKNHKRTAVYADCSTFNLPIDMHKELSSKTSVVEGGRIQVTASSELNAVSAQLDWLDWLPYCAKEYQISADPKDYVLMPTIICPSDIPNRNGVGFPLDELIRFDPETHQQVYKGWKGCPTFNEHQNDDHTKARGVVIDSVMRQVQGFKGGIRKVLGLAAFDRNKYPELVARLLTRQTTDVSMGAYVTSYSCGLCLKPAGECNHINMRNGRDFRIDPISGKLIYRRCHGLSPFELSSVQTPAWTVSSSAMTVDLAAGTAYT